MEGRRDSILQRILAKTIRDDPNFTYKGTHCWLWQGGTSGTGRGEGYGRISINSFTSAVHRVMFVHYYGYIPAKKQVDHLCKNRLCCNPEHLELVSGKENYRRRDNYE